MCVRMYIQMHISHSGIYNGFNLKKKKFQTDYEYSSGLVEQRRLCTVSMNR